MLLPKIARLSRRIDFLGNPRVVDGDGNGSVLPDIGAYEFIPPELRAAYQLDLIGTTDEVGAQEAMPQNTLGTAVSRFPGNSAAPLREAVDDAFSPANSRTSNRE